MHRRTNIYLRLLIVMLASTGTEALIAQTVPESGGNAIVVTARKHSESLQNVPISVTALGGGALAQHGQDDFEKVAKTVPSLSFIDLGPGQSQISIRGINTGAVSRDDTARKESVGVYLNDVPVSVALFNPDLDTFDLARVEVLRGPQGTLYGAGSLAGTVRLITAPPTMDALHLKLDGTLSHTQGSGDPNGDIKGAINIPIAADLVAIRAVGYYDSNDGYIDNSATGQKDVNSSRKYGVRIAGLLTPTNGLKIAPLFVWQRVRTDGFPQQDVQSIIGTTTSADIVAALPASRKATPDPLVPGQYLIGNPAGGSYEQYRQSPEGLRDDFKLYSLQADYDFGPATLTSVSSLMKRNVSAQRDLTYFLNSVFGPLPTVNYDLVPASLNDDTQLTTFTQEMRLASSRPGPLEWVIGGFYQHEKRQYTQSADAPGFEAQTGYPASLAGLGADVLYLANFNLRLRQYAAFGEATLAITDKLKATAGLRYYRYEQSRDVELQGLLNNFEVTTQQSGTKASGVNPRFILAYKPDRNLLVSLQAAKGFKLGGPTDPLPAICDGDPGAGSISSGEFKPETLWNYELGVKSTLAGGALTVNAAAFRIDYTNLQLNRRLSCSFTVTTNGGKARSQGVELEIAAQPLRGLQLNLSGSYVDAKLRSDESGLNARSGDRLPLSPKLSFNLNGRYTMPVSDDWNAFVDVTYQYVGSVVAFFNSELPDSPPVDAAGNRVPSYDLVNLRVGLSGKHYEVSLFADNLFDKRAIITPDRERVGYLVTGTIGRDARLDYIRNRPRTVGLNAKLNF